MKKCPKCKADIQEEARFCLYCMTSFEEKQTIENKEENNKRWLIIIAAVLVLVLIVACIFLFTQKDSQANGENDTSSISSISSDLDASDDNNKTSSEQQNSESQGNETSTPTSSNQTPASSKNESNTSNNNSGNTTTNNVTTNSNSQNSNTNNTTNSSSNSTSNSSTSGTTPSNPTPNTSTSTDNTTSSGTSSSSPTVTQPQYTYIEATIQNAYPTVYSAMYAPENAIVITKVNYREENGKYVIPDTIDGKKVAAIMPSAFSDSSISSSVKSVTLPATVRTIWEDAFKNCFNLTDLYIKSSVIGIYENAFPASVSRNGKITFHCKSDCRDFNFYYYRNIAERYDATYEEWNG